MACHLCCDIKHASSFVFTEPTAHDTDDPHDWVISNLQKLNNTTSATVVV
jgi:hypothetical protein